MSIDGLECFENMAKEIGMRSIGIYANTSHDAVRIFQKMVEIDAGRGSLEIRLNSKLGSTRYSFDVFGDSKMINELRAWAGDYEVTT